MIARALRVLAAASAAAAIVAAPAFGSLGGEVSAGRGVAAQLGRGTTGCATLSSSQLEHLGEYVMDRLVGSRPAHEAMNARMVQALGAKSADRMHAAMGRRFAGCATGVAGGPTGPRMMGGPATGAGWGMPGWRWMRDGSWRHMNRSDWRGLAGTMMGSRSMGGHHGWGAVAVVAVTLAAVLLAAVLLLVLHVWRRRPPAAPTAA